MLRVIRAVRPARRLLVVVLAAALALAALASGAGASVVSQSASMDGGKLSGFSQLNTLASTLAVDSSRAYDGTYSAKASYLGGADNAYSRGLWNVNWVTGDDVWYSAAYYLPVGFKSAMQGEVDLLRWDNWLSHPSDTDWGGVVIYGGDKQARLMRFNMKGSSTVLVGPFDVPEGRWFTLEVHQRLSGSAGAALSELYLDGTLVGRSTAANTYGRTIERLRTGLVADGGAKQTKPLTLWFDRARISTGPTTLAGAASQRTAASDQPAAATREQRAAQHRRAVRHRRAVLRHRRALAHRRAVLRHRRALAHRRAHARRHHRHHRRAHRAHAPR
ncbi:MAG: hypothetical protein JSS99_00965 [Actinobacteria bacterium]|nr:hypothetical protein [Actinomycetota bacterium]